MAEDSPKGRKEEIACNFSVSHSVFKRLVLKTHKNKGLFGKGLKQFGKKEMLVTNIFFP